MNNTSYKNYKINKATMASTVVLLAMFILFFSLFIYIYKHPITEEGLFSIFAFKILFLIVTGFLSCFTFFSIVGYLFGFIKGILKISLEKNNIKKYNPYVYYRELPNNYGIGVNTLLLDSKIENFKDIVAVLLDLCARKYISLIKTNDKYVIKIIKSIDSNLLDNEKYILSLIYKNNLKDLDYTTWYNYCLKDGMNLGLFYPRDVKVNNKPLLDNNSFNKYFNTIKKTSLIISIIIFFVIFLIGGPLFALIGSIIIYYLILIICWFILSLIGMIISIKNISKQTTSSSYKILLDNQLSITEKGIKELHKLYSFKSFINDFGNFVDKRVEEVYLWDRYLSYAQVFGLTKEIMNTGYKQLIENNSFKIDNIDNINFDNIEIK